MRRHTTKLFLDSRYSLPDGTFLVPGEAILMEPSSRCWLSEFTCVASWHTIDESNRRFGVVEGGSHRTCVLPVGPHDLESLRTAMETAMNASRPAGAGPYTVVRTSSGTSGSTFRTFTVSTAAGSLPFQIPLASNDLRHIVSWPFGDLNIVQHTSTFVDVRRIHSLFLHTSFGSNNCVTPTGVRGVLAKIPVTAGYGGLVHYVTSGSEHDHVECGTSALSSMKIRLCDVAGRELDLQGTSWSCTLVFEK